LPGFFLLFFTFFMTGPNNRLPSVFVG